MDSSPASLLTKPLLRRAIRERIHLLPAGERRQADLAICRHLLLLARELGTGVLLGYFALADEVRIDGFLAGAVEQGRSVLLPWSREGRLVFRCWRPTTVLERDGEGVLAPAGIDREGEAVRAGMIVVPGRAFDRTGGRLGRGGGYYDRLLASPAGASRFVVGAAYECQVVDGVPSEPHDRPVDILVTEQGWRRMRSSESVDQATASRTSKKGRDESGFER
jgi:5-formyltetrahydrofolate cyclo-ligase